MLGLLAGALTGLSPGLHVNNVAALVLATQTAFAGFLSVLVPDISAAPETMGLLLSCFLLATAGSHAVFDFIPAVFLGASTEDTALATLPGHRLLLVGQGAKAVALAARGALLGSAFAVVALLPLRLILADPVGLADHFRPWAPVFLVCVLGGVLASEWRGRSRIRRLARAVWVQALAGGLGLAVLRGPPLVDPDAVLFPLFSGLFGIPSLLVGLRARPGSIPYQRLEPLRALSREDARSALRGTIPGASVSRLPGLRRGAATLLAAATGPVGVGLACLSAIVGLVPVALRVRRVHLMASLLIPVLLTYLGPGG